jgi:hypothetical protein
VIKEETQKSLIELQETTNKRVKELNKTIQDLKMEVETIKKLQRKTKLEIPILGEKSGSIDVSISTRIQEMEERISGAENTTKKTLTQQLKKMQKAHSPKHPGNPGHNEKSKSKNNRYRRAKISNLKGQ